MKPALACLTILIATALWAPPLVARDVIYMNSGDTFTGRVLDDDGEHVQFETAEGMIMKIPYADLAPESIFDLMRHRTAKDDAKGQIAVGDYAAEHGLFRDATRAYGLAVAADPSTKDEIDKRLANLSQTASASLMAEAKKSESNGQHKDARAYLGEIMKQYPESATAKDASSMLTSINDTMKEDHDKEVAQKESDEMKHELDPISKLYKTMLDKVHDGLQNSSNQSGSIDDFKKALDEGERALKKVAELRKKASDGGPMSEALDSLGGKIKDESVEATVHLADAYTLRGSYNQATEVINKALAADPKNERLIAMREQIASDNADSSVGIIGVRRGGAVLPSGRGR